MGNLLPKAPVRMGGRQVAPSAKPLFFIIYLFIIIYLIIYLCTSGNSAQEEGKAKQTGR